MSAPVLLTTRERIRSVAARWREQYFERDGGVQWKETMSGSSRTVYNQLLALNTETALAADVKSIIGNDGWTGIRCEGCSQTVDEAVRIGADDVPRYGDEPRTALLCRSCVEAALNLFPSKP